MKEHLKNISANIVVDPIVCTLEGKLLLFTGFKWISLFVQKGN